MEYKPEPTKEAPDFLCPTCGASAFEVVDKQWNLGETGVDEEFLVLKCLGCLELFHHHLPSEEPAPCPPETISTEVS